MTREEAVKYFKRHLDLYCVDGISREAEEMAIKALSQEPCDDTVSIRKDVLKCRVGKLVVYNVEWLKKHWQMEMDIVCGVKPCDDAISREAVYSILNEYHIGEEEIESAMDESQNLTVNGIISDVSLLPSVTQKSGKWIEHPEIETSTPEYLMFYECSECGNKQCFCKSDIHKKRFCSNCGAKMVEPQESEEISERNMKMWEELFKAESEVGNE